MDNKEIIGELINRYDEMNSCLESIQSLINDDVKDKSKIIEMYEKINNMRNEVRELIGEYTPTDDITEAKNMKTLRRGFLAIINTVKASMLVENSYEGQRGINRISLETLIPVISFKLHHLPNSDDEIYTSQYFLGIENICQEQTGLINKQISKSEDAKNTLEEDLKNVNILLKDYDSAVSVYKGLNENKLLNDFKKVLIQIEPEKRRILSEIRLKNTSSKQFSANLNTIDDLNKKTFDFKPSTTFDIEIDDDNIIGIGELQEINNDINENLKKLDDTINMLKNKVNLLEKDREKLAMVRDDFLKNTAQENASESQE